MLDFIESFDLQDYYRNFFQTSYFISLEKIIDSFECISIEKTKESIKVLLTEYKEELKSIILKKGDNFYRGRIGCILEKGAIDDCDIDVTYPFYDSQISAPPTSLTSAGRFNREFFSYLYLATSKETCISELKLDVNQICSIAKFELKKEGEFFDLRFSTPENFLFFLNKILLVPVNSDNRFLYSITQVFSDSIKELGYRGIIYPSSRVNKIDDYNLVSFYPKDFEYIKFSEKLFSVKSINYTIEEKEESYKKYKDYDTLLSDYSSEEDTRKEKLFEHIQEKIEIEKRKKNSVQS